MIDLSHTIHKLMSHTDLLIEAAGGTTRLLPLLRLKRLNENKRGDRDGDAPLPYPSWLLMNRDPSFTYSLSLLRVGITIYFVFF